MCVCKGMDEQSPTTSISDSPAETILQLPVPDLKGHKHEAAIKVQKVYRSFQTRRKLADCAVLIEQSWWKLIDFVELKRSSVSFFEVEKHESAVSRWSRAGTRAAKVGKGLSKNSKAQKLALQHWLEAIDPRHRYGHNLHFYYEEWLESQSNEPFFYWLDIGEGKEVNIVESCPRLKLQQQCIKYLGPLERTSYEVVVDDGKLIYKQSRLLVHAKEPKDVKWIFVLSTSMTLYVAQKRKGTFQHSSFLAGGATSAAGRIIVDNGILKAVWPHSGHYRPTQENFQDFIAYLRRNHVNLTNVKLEPVDEEEKEEEEEETLSKQQSVTLTSTSSGSDNGDDSTEEEDSNNKSNNKKGALLPNLLIPGREDFIESLKIENKMAESDYEEGEEEKEEEEEEEEEEVGVSEEHIVERINIKRNMKSYQLGKQLSSKWSSGVGPRIGCLRDYPMELQSHTLEQAMLSPMPMAIPKGSRRHARSSTAILTNNNNLGEEDTVLRRQRRRMRKMSYSGELSRIREGFPLASPLRKISARMDCNR